MKWFKRFFKKEWVEIKIPEFLKKKEETPEKTEKEKEEE